MTDDAACWYGVLARTRVCVHKHAPCEMGQGYGREKGPPLISSCNPPASRLCLSKLDFILQKQSGMNNSFSSPSFCFFCLSFPFSYPLFLVFLSCSTLSLSSVCLWYFFPPSTSISFLLPSILLFLLLALRVLFCLFFESLDSWQILSTAGCSLQWTCVL